MFQFIKDLFTGDDDDEDLEPILANLDTGWIFNYAAEEWLVDEVTDLTDGKSEWKEFTATTTNIGKKTTKHIEYFHDDHVKVYDHLNVAAFKSPSIDKDIRDCLDGFAENEPTPPQTLEFEGVTYHYNRYGQSSRDGSTDCLFWEYITQNEKAYLRFEQWDDDDYTGCVGVFTNVHAFEIIGDGGNG